MTDIPTYSQPVASLDAETRGTFVIRVYQHVLLAVGAFVAFEAVLFGLGVARAMYEFLAGSSIGWLLLLGIFTGVNWVATQAAHDLSNLNKQYAGLFAMAGMEAVLFAPFLYIVFNVVEGGTATVAAAAILTAVGFTALSVIAFVTRKDLSFIRPMMMWGFGGAMLLILGSILFGFQLGVWFSVAMIVLAGGSILYQTQNIMARYPSEAYVGAAVQLFASLMMMFWYILRLLMQLRR